MKVCLIFLAVLKLTSVKDSTILTERKAPKGKGNLARTIIFFFYPLTLQEMTQAVLYNSASLIRLSQKSS